MKAAYEAGGEEECKRLLERKRDEWKNLPLNVAVTGKAGAGKSFFINVIRGLTADDEGAAAVGVTETTTKPRSYPHPDNPKLLFWDLPGVGTDKFPRETYLTDIDVDRYDFFLLITDTRFMQNDAWLGEEFRKRNKKYFFVRTKTEQDVTSDSEAHPKTHSEEAVLKRIRESTTEILREHGFDDVPVFLIDNCKPTKFDFERLKLQLIEDFPVLKKSALIFSLQASSEQMIRLKVAALRSRIRKIVKLVNKFAFLSLYILDLRGCVDLPIVFDEAKFYFEQLCIDNKSLQRYADVYSVDYDKLRSIVSIALDIREEDVVTENMSNILAYMYKRTIGSHPSVKKSVSVGSTIAMPFRRDRVAYQALTLVLGKFEEAAIEVSKCVWADSMASFE